MRYPVYFFLLLTGFFYLTGKPLQDKDVEKPVAGVVTKVKQLKYAQNTSSELRKSGDTGHFGLTAKPSKSAADSLKVASLETKGRTTSGSAEKSAPVTRKTTSWTTTTKPATRPLTVAVSNGRWLTRTVETRQPQITQPALASSKNSSSGVSSSIGLSSGKVASLEGRDKKQFKIGARKSLDWTVFGNQRERNTLSPPPGMPSQDVLDAERIPSDARQATGSNRYAVKKQRKSRSVRRAVKKRLARKRARAARNSRSRRYARLKRKNKGVYRIARRAKKKSPRRRYNKRPRRKKFGFSTTAGTTSLGGF